jgi:putative transcriptional regulator
VQAFIIKNRLKNVRYQNKQTQEQLANAVGVSRQTISTIENDGGNPTAELMFSIAQYYNLSILEIFYPELLGDD